MSIHISTWDPSEHLETDEDILIYLNEAFADGDPALIQTAIGYIATNTKGSPGGEPFVATMGT